MGIDDAEHQETAPDASKLIISKLTCSLVGKKERIRITPGTVAGRAFGRGETIEEFRCNYGLNPAYQQQFAASALRTVGVDDTGECRIVELPDHRFFVATLFLPQLSSGPGAPHPLISALVAQAASLRV
jgi:CTP synthase (UTP-ammonia lyase)